MTDIFSHLKSTRYEAASAEAWRWYGYWTAAARDAEQKGHYETAASCRRLADLERETAERIDRHTKERS